ncbi:hypothetical protein NP603_12055 [Methylomonas sp. SURF-1]|uniref:Uncharacterized protein n=1 Tax=Methylomonas aurea TaxID=2952224 RepID=A0ABT1UHY4_9GAMM|nr:hypothetical protein [Methylomonas sp. SURF-1]MCQ8181844.1 hypothetical protein [Methylomonas sp. SURF-1]
MLPSVSGVPTTSRLRDDNPYSAESYAEIGVVCAFAIAPRVLVCHRYLQQSAFFRNYVSRNYLSRLASVIRCIAGLMFAASTAGDYRHVPSNGVRMSKNVPYGF